MGSIPSGCPGVCFHTYSHYQGNQWMVTMWNDFMVNSMSIDGTFQLIHVHVACRPYPHPQPAVNMYMLWLMIKQLSLALEVFRT